MIDLKLGSDGDLETSDFDLHFVTAGEQTAQRLKIRLRMLFGEYFLDTSKGFPWFEEILGVKPLSLDRVDAVFREHILVDAEILSIESFQMNYNNSTRVFSLAFKAFTIYGPIDVSDEITEVLP